MMMILMIMIESMMMLTSDGTVIMMIAITTMITIKVDWHVSLGNGYVRTSAPTPDHLHAELRAVLKVIFPNASCADCRKSAIWHELSSLTSPPAVERVSQNLGSRESEP